jgi:hypothetical protein
MRNVSNKYCGVDQNTIPYSITFFENLAVYEIKLKNVCEAVQNTDDITGHVHCMLCNYGIK